MRESLLVPLQSRISELVGLYADKIAKRYEVLQNLLGDKKLKIITVGAAALQFMMQQDGWSAKLGPPRKNGTRLVGSWREVPIFKHAKTPPSAIAATVNGDPVDSCIML